MSARPQENPPSRSRHGAPRSVAHPRRPDPVEPGAQVNGPGWNGAIPAQPAMLAATARHVIDAVPGMGRTVAVEAVLQATGHARPLRGLHDHLAAHPDALSS